VQEGLGRDPFVGDVYVFRGRSGSLIKAIWHDGVGLSLYAKRARSNETSKFPT
jgi:transposase